MKRTTFGKAAISSLIVATTMVGCTGAAFRPSASVVKQKNDATKQAAAAEKAINAHQAVQAVSFAEAAVQVAPDNAAYRQILGRAYVASGRFTSAETALTDAMTLGNTDARTIISLALVKVALGKNDDARALLSANADKLPVADYGLALAMAGDAPQGVQMLSAAVNDPSANARTRQNLAYVYALAGRWKDARVMAGQDLDPLVANQRISQWAMMADPSLAPQRVAALMGVTLDTADAGQPVALTLAPAAAPTALAEAAPVTAPATDGPIQTADVPPSVIETATPAPVIQADASPVRVAAATASSAFVVEQAGAPRSKAVKTKPAPAAAAEAPVARIQQAALIKPAGHSASNWVVQLGAYDTAAIAKDKWMSMARINSTLAAFPVLTSQATVKGKPFHRLAISGFASRNDALSLCHSIQAQRGQCFVREGAPGATLQRWALATKGRQFASR